MAHNKNLGNFGEKIAKNYLIRHGYSIINANVKLSYQELDLVASRDGLLGFIEVKTRISQFFGPAENAFGRIKAERFRRGAEMYLRKNNILADNIRLDLITVDIDQYTKTAKIKHYQDVV